MGRAIGPDLITASLTECWDAANRISYPGIGTTWADLVNRKNCTLINGVAFDSSYMGFMEFDGTDGYADTGVQIWDGVGDFSATAWFKTTASSGERDLICQRENTSNSQNNGLWLIRLSGSTLQMVLRDTGKTYTRTTSLSGDYNDGVWYYVVIRRSGTTCYLSIDDIAEEVSVSAANDLAHANNVFRIGGFVNAADYWDGGIAAVTFYDVALSHEQIKQNYNCVKARFGR